MVQHAANAPQAVDTERLLHGHSNPRETLGKRSGNGTPLICLPLAPSALARVPCPAPPLAPSPVFQEASISKNKQTYVRRIQSCQHFWLLEPYSEPQRRKSACSGFCNAPPLSYAQPCSQPATAMSVLACRHWKKGPDQMCWPLYEQLSSHQ